MDNLHDQIRDLFSEALTLPTSEWSDFLGRRCPDAILRARVEALLDQYARSGEFLSRPAVETYPSIAGAIGGQLGEFRIVKEIGRGGMGIVYLAEDLALKRAVALKVLPVMQHGETVLTDRFHREAQAVARLSHPGIVRIYRTGEERGHSYIAMEYVEGETLHARLASKAAQAGTAPPPAPRDWAECARLVSEIADALEHAHDHGVIHRDVKPSNIMIDTTGRARLTDFGVARIDSESTLTSAGEISGSFRYMSPEQARVRAVQIDHRTDVFSLGVVMYEMLTGARPFDGATPQEILKALADHEATLVSSLNPSVPRDLVTICHKAIEKPVLSRYQSAAHLSADVRSWLAGMPILARPPSLLERLGRRLSSRRSAIVTLGATAGAVVLGAYGYRWATDNRPRLILEGTPSNAKAYVQYFEAESVRFGTARFLGTGSKFRLESGFCRITVEAPGSAFAEFSRFIRGDCVIGAGATFLDTRRIASEMILISGEAQSSDPEYSRNCGNLPPFYIDPTEVSNADYARFLASTRNPPPHPVLWGGATPPESWGDLPVVGVTLLEARSYAEWAGKRLPTSAEWERAARGLDGRTFPWPDQEFRPVWELANSRRDETLAGLAPPVDAASQREYLGNNLRRVHDISGLADLTTTGLLHMFGNVAEWTETPRGAGGWKDSQGREASAYIVRSDMWARSRSEPRSDLRIKMLKPEYERAIGIGFRCAKSMSVPSVI